MFDEETLMGESIDFQAPMNAACSRVRPKGRRCSIGPHLLCDAGTHAFTGPAAVHDCQHHSGRLVMSF